MFTVLHHRQDPSDQHHSWCPPPCLHPAPAVQSLEVSRWKGGSIDVPTDAMPMQIRLVLADETLRTCLWYARGFALFMFMKCVLHFAMHGTSVFDGLWVVTQRLLPRVTRCAWGRLDRRTCGQVRSCSVFFYGVVFPTNATELWCDLLSWYFQSRPRIR